MYDIEFVEAQNKKVVFFLRNDKRIEVGQPLRTFEDQLLAEDGFFGCHRSYLVNLANISFFNSLSIQTKCGRTVPVARGTAKAFEQAYFTFVFHE